MRTAIDRNWPRPRRICSRKAGTGPPRSNFSDGRHRRLGKRTGRASSRLQTAAPTPVGEMSALRRHRPPIMVTGSPADPIAAQEAAWVSGCVATRTGTGAGRPAIAAAATVGPPEGSRRQPLCAGSQTFRTVASVRSHEQIGKAIRHRPRRLRGRSLSTTRLFPARTRPVTGRWSMCRKKQLFLGPPAANLALHLFTLKIFLASV
jgi:hypothetical protein